MTLQENNGTQPANKMLSRQIRPHERSHLMCSYGDWSMALFEGEASDRKGLAKVLVPCPDSERR